MWFAVCRKKNKWEQYEIINNDFEELCLKRLWSRHTRKKWPELLSSGWLKQRILVMLFCVSCSLRLPSELQRCFVPPHVWRKTLIFNPEMIRWVIFLGCRHLKCTFIEQHLHSSQPEGCWKALWQTSYNKSGISFWFYTADSEDILEKSKQVNFRKQHFSKAAHKEQVIELSLVGFPPCSHGGTNVPVTTTMNGTEVRRQKRGLCAQTAQLPAAHMWRVWTCTAEWSHATTF